MVKKAAIRDWESIDFYFDIQGMKKAKWPL
jgi:hypothetical protein